MKHEVYSAFPCISFRNINSGTLKNVSVDFMQAQRYILSSIFGPRQTQSVSENAISSPCTVQFPPFILSSRVILSIYRFKRDNFLSENVLFEVRFFCEKCQTCICGDCAILEHQDHNKISLEQGLENNKFEIEDKMRKVEANGSRLKTMKECLEKRRLEVNNSIEEATSEVKRIAQQRISLIQQHEATVTEQLLEKKAAFKEAFLAQIATVWMTKRWKLTTL